MFFLLNALEMSVMATLKYALELSVLYKIFLIHTCTMYHSNDPGSSII